MELGHCLWAIPVVIVDINICFILFDQSWIVISSQHNKQLKPPPPYLLEDERTATPGACVQEGTRRETGGEGAR